MGNWCFYVHPFHILLILFRAPVVARGLLSYSCPMIHLFDSLNAWATPQFNAVLTRELEALPVDQLPLQRAMSHGSRVLDDQRSVLIISVTDTAEVIRAKVGVFYSGIIAGCSCADDPTPVEAVNEYCEMWLVLDKRTGEAAVSLVD